jgi:hypothetical protein
MLSGGSVVARDVRPITIEGDAAYVALTKGYKAVIDAEDAHLVDGWNWTALVRRNTVYAYRKDCSGQKLRAAYMHRVIMGEPEGLQVDHRDGDGLNNCRSNLREATHAENMRNRRLGRDNTTGFKGVAWHKASGKYQAKIRLNGERKWLGLHDTPEAAHAAYRKASTRLHGEFGRIS